MKILLTGSHGQIGWELNRALSATSHEIAAPDHHQFDLTQLPQIRRTIRDLAPDIIINAAGYTGVDRAESEPELASAVNGQAPGVLAEEAQRCNALLVHYSTDYVFDGRKRAPYHPDDAPNPLNVYGRTKLEGELAIQRTDARALILRTCWVFSLRRSNFLRTMLKLAETKPELRIVNDQTGSPTWSRLIAQGTAQILDAFASNPEIPTSWSKPSRVDHLACAGQASWFDFASRIFECADLDAPPIVHPISTEEYPTPAKRPSYSVLDCARTKQDFGVELSPWSDAVRIALKNRDTDGTVANVVHAGREEA